MDEWVQAVNEHGGFGKWSSDVCLEPAGLSKLPSVLDLGAKPAIP
jgi:hypothetical protein